MPAPQAIFLDTGILDREHYDFSSSRIQALLTASRGQNLALILPHPTSLEITRHIGERARLAIASLMRARETHAFLRGVTGIPQNRAERDQQIQNLRTTVLSNWDAFKAKFSLQELDYAGINIAEVMNWYDQVKPPFGLGDKAKEFPDAFSLAALHAYTAATGKIIAVVSTDNDFKKACDTAPNLKFFPTLDALTSELIAEKQARFNQAVLLAHASVSLLSARIVADFPDRAFNHVDDPNGKGSVENISVTQVIIDPSDMTVIGLDGDNFEISYTATLTFTADVEYDDPNSWVSGDPGDDVFFLHHCSGKIEEEITVSGIAEFGTDSTWTAPAELISLSIDEDWIEIHAEAPQADDHEEL